MHLFPFNPTQDRVRVARLVSLKDIYDKLCQFIRKHPKSPGLPITPVKHIPYCLWSIQDHNKIHLSTIQLSYDEATRTVISDNCPQLQHILEYLAEKDDIPNYFKFVGTQRMCEIAKRILEGKKNVEYIEVSISDDRPDALDKDFGRRSRLDVVDIDSSGESATSDRDFGRRLRLDDVDIHSSGDRVDESAASDVSRNTSDGERMDESAHPAASDDFAPGITLEDDGSGFGEPYRPPPSRPALWDVSMPWTRRVVESSLPAPSRWRPAPSRPAPPLERSPISEGVDYYPSAQGVTQSPQKLKFLNLSRLDSTVLSKIKSVFEDFVSQSPQLAHVVFIDTDTSFDSNASMIKKLFEDTSRKCYIVILTESASDDTKWFERTQPTLRKIVDEGFFLDQYVYGLTYTTSLSDIRLYSLSERDE